MNNVPVWLEWVTVALSAAGAIGLVVAVLQLLDGIFGAPKLDVTFGAAMQPPNMQGVATKALVCRVRNPPVAGVLAKLGVKRRAAVAVITGMEIRELGSGRVVVPDLSLQLANGPSTTAIPSVEFSSSPVFSGFPVAMLMLDTMEAQSRDAENTKYVLANGAYACQVTLTWDNQRRVATNSFTVAASVEAFSWRAGLTPA